MSVPHVGGRPTLPVVSQQQSAPKTHGQTAAGATLLDRTLLPDTRKVLPEQAKGAAHGLSVQKFFDKWDSDSDGTITAAEAGPRFGHGVLAELLKLQESSSAGATDPADAQPDPGDGSAPQTASDPAAALGPAAPDPTPI
jgi:hypothetical protein